MRQMMKWKQWWVALAALLMLAIMPIAQVHASECMGFEQAQVIAHTPHSNLCEKASDKQAADHGLSCKLACISSPAALPELMPFKFSEKVRETVLFQLNNAVEGVSPKPIHGPPRA